MKKHKKKSSVKKYNPGKKSYSHVVIGLLSIAFGFAGVYLMLTQVVSSIVSLDYSDAASKKKYETYATKPVKKNYFDQLLSELNIINLNALDSELR